MGNQPIIARKVGMLDGQLKIIICLLQFIIKEEIGLRELKILQLQRLGHIVSNDL